MYTKSNLKKKQNSADVGFLSHPYISKIIIILYI